ncbi:MAG: hypothetical protein CTY15_13355 [Methylocystis sp.]|nr:MAG: hypothetical protein CTY15_13355 [Methylocystis sp.]
MEATATGALAEGFDGGLVTTPARAGAFLTAAGAPAAFLTAKFLTAEFFEAELLAAELLEAEFPACLVVVAFAAEVLAAEDLAAEVLAAEDLAAGVLVELLAVGLLVALAEFFAAAFDAAALRPPAVLVAFADIEAVLDVVVAGAALALVAALAVFGEDLVAAAVATLAAARVRAVGVFERAGALVAVLLSATVLRLAPAVRALPPVARDLPADFLAEPRALEDAAGAPPPFFFSFFLADGIRGTLLLRPAVETGRR